MPPAQKTRGTLWRGRPDPASGAAYPPPDLTGRTIGTWQVLYETSVEGKRHCMCRCVRCGVRKIFPAFKLWKGYALRCQGCRVEREARGPGAEEVSSPLL